MHKRYWFIAVIIANNYTPTKKVWGVSIGVNVLVGQLIVFVCAISQNVSDGVTPLLLFSSCVGTISPKELDFNLTLQECFSSNIVV